MSDEEKKVIGLKVCFMLSKVWVIPDCFVLSLYTYTVVVYGFSTCHPQVKHFKTESLLCEYALLTKKETEM